MTRLRTLTLAGLAAVLLALGALAGSIVTTVNAEGPPLDFYRPTAADGSGGVPGWVLDAWAERYGGADQDAERDAGEAEAIVCPLETGCTIEVVNAEGVTVKVMHVTFSDPEDAETAEISE